MIFRFALSNPVYGTFILPHDPVGWEDLVIEFNRDKELHGIDVSCNVPVKFFCGAGKEYIDKIYDEYGVDGQISFNILTVCGCIPGEDSLDYSIDYSDDYGTPSEGCDFEPFFEGVLNLSTYGTDRDYSYADVEQVSMYTTFKSRLDTKVILTDTNTIDGGPMNSYSFAPYQMTLHSKEIVFKSEWQPHPPGNHFETDTFELGLRHSPPLDLTIADIPGSQSSFTESTDPSSAIWQNLVGAEQTINITGFIKVGTYQELTYRTEGGTSSATINISGGYTYFISVLDESWNLVSFQQLHQEPNVPSLVTLDSSFDINVTLTVPPLHYVNLLYQLDNIDFSGYPTPDSGNPLSPLEYLSVHAEYLYHTDSIVNGVINSTVPESQCNVFAIHEALAIVAQSITNDPDPIRSNYFGRKNSEPVAYDSNGCGSFRAITNGLQIRQFPLISTDPKKNKPHSISMKELYFGLDPIDNLGMGVEKIGDSHKIRIEPKDHFYDNSVLFRLSNLDLKMTVATEYYYNNITIGYSTWENEEINGIDEFNSKRQFTLGLKTISETDEILSNLVASGYAIEFTRRKPYRDNSTEDYKYDNNTFIICLNRSTDGAGIPTGLTIAEKDENYADIEDLISPQTAYNLRIAPLRNLLRRSNVINPSIYKYPGKDIKFTYGEGNYVMSSRQLDNCSGAWNNSVLNDGTSYQWDSPDNSDNNPIWIPEFYEFTAPLTFTQFKQLQESPYKCIEFSTGEDNYKKGYIIELRYRMLTGLTQFKLLRAWE
jgi:hypothetical protein